MIAWGICIVIPEALYWRIGRALCTFIQRYQQTILCYCIWQTNYVNPETVAVNISVLHHILLTTRIIYHLSVGGDVWLMPSKTNTEHWLCHLCIFSFLAQISNLHVRFEPQYLCRLRQETRIIYRMQKNLQYCRKATLGVPPKNRDFKYVYLYVYIACAVLWRWMVGAMQIAYGIYFEVS